MAAGVVVVVAVLAVAVFEVQTLWIDDEVAEAGPQFESGAVIDDAAGEDTPTGGTEPGPADGSDAPPDQGVAVTKVSEGTFEGRDHDGEGTVILLTDGRQTFVRFEDDFATENGPDLYAVVYVGGERVELGQLKGNQGSQNYELPANIDAESVEGVAVWCKRFDSTFTEADLS